MIIDFKEKEKTISEKMKEQARKKKRKRRLKNI